MGEGQPSLVIIAVVHGCREQLLLFVGTVFSLSLSCCPFPVIVVPIVLFLLTLSPSLSCLIVIVPVVVPFILMIVVAPVMLIVVVPSWSYLVHLCVQAVSVI